MPLDRTSESAVAARRVIREFEKEALANGMEPKDIQKKKLVRPSCARPPARPCNPQMASGVAAAGARWLAAFL